MLQCQGHIGLLDSWVFLVLLSPWLSKQSCKHLAKHIIQLDECLGHVFQRLIKKKKKTSLCDMIVTLEPINFT